MAEVVRARAGCKIPPSLIKDMSKPLPVDVMLRGNAKLHICSDARSVSVTGHGEELKNHRIKESWKEDVAMAPQKKVRVGRRIGWLGLRYP